MARATFPAILVAAASILPPFAAGQTAPATGIPAVQFDLEAARHLLLRAGFGGTAEEVREIAALGLRNAVDFIVDYESLPEPARFTASVTTNRPERGTLIGKTEDERRKAVQAAQRADRQQFEAIRTWWLRRMIDTDRPLEEKMVLFLHGHFTSSMRDVKNSYHMLLQNELLRKHATGNFRTLVHAISKDPAMLEYLDNNRNRRGKPNENYARELMELFTLGIGNYTEEDIKAAARAFTGWTFRDNQFEFQRRQHDEGEKTFLGRRGRFNGEDIVNIIFDQPAAAEYVAGKIFRFFVHENPSDDTIRACAKVLRDSGYEMKPLLKAIFTSPEFYGAEARGTHVKSPVELVVSTARMLGIRSDAMGRLGHFAATQMGQSLMDPPTVKGWDGGRSWISTSTLYTRYNFAGFVTGAIADGRELMGRGRDVPADAADDTAAGKREATTRPLRALQGDAFGREMLRNLGGLRMRTVFTPVAEIRQSNLRTAEDVLRHFEERILVVRLTGEARAELLRYLNTDARGAESPFDARRPDADRRVRGMLHLMMSSPEYQLS